MPTTTAGQQLRWLQSVTVSAHDDGTTMTRTTASGQLKLPPSAVVVVVEVMEQRRIRPAIKSFTLSVFVYVCRPLLLGKMLPRTVCAINWCSHTHTH